MTEAAAALTAAGIQAAATGGSIAVSGKMNKKAVREQRRNREWATKEREAQNAWNLEQWNRTNEYNSPAAQMQRLKDAGISPSAFLNNGSASMVAASTPDGSADPGVTTPQMWNPSSDVGNLISQIGQGYIQFQQLENDKKRVENETRSSKADADYKYGLLKTEDLLRENKFMLGGAQFELTKEQVGKTKDERRLLAENITKTQHEIEQIDQYREYLGAQTSLASWERYAREKKLPLELKEAGARMCLMRTQAADIKQSFGHRMNLLKKQGTLLESQNYGQYLSNQEEYSYFKSGNWKRDMNNRSDILEEQKLQTRGGTYSKFGYSVIRGSNIVTNFLQPFVQAWSGYTNYLGAKKMQFQMMPKSSPNPQGPGFDTSQPNGVGQYY